MSASFVRPVPISSPSIRLFCIPFAGVGPSAFRGWAQEFGGDIETLYGHLPGREGRLREEPLSSVPAMAEALVDAMGSLVDRPFAVFGHSLGGLVAFEALRELRRRGLPSPIALFVSATWAPQVSRGHPPLRHLPDAELLRAVNARYDGSVPNVVLDSPEMIELLAPALRADLTALETYEYRSDLPLDCPINVFGGRRDAVVPCEALEPWSTHTTAAFQLRLLEEGHLFLQSRLKDVVHAVRADLDALTGLLPAGKRSDADSAVRRLA